MKNKKLKSRAETAVVIAAVIAAVALANYLSNRLFFRLDLTEDKQYTVSDATKRILKNLDDVVNVKVFFSKNLPPDMHVTVNTVRDLLNEYGNIAGGRLRVTWEDPADNEEARVSANTVGVHEIQLRTFKQDRAEFMVGYMGIGIIYGEKHEAIPIVQNLSTLEYELTMAIMKVKRGSPPKIGVLKSQSADNIPAQIRTQMNMDGETTEQRFAPIFENFRRDYEVVAVDPSDGKPIDREIRTLIIPGGDRFTDRAIFEIDQYFMNGGNLIALANGVNVTFSQYGMNAAVQETKFLELLEYYGARVERNLIMDASCGQVQVPQQYGYITLNQMYPYPYLVRVLGNGFSQDNPVMSVQSELMLNWSSSLTLAPDTAGIRGNITAAALFSSSGESWTITENFDLSPRHPNDYDIPGFTGPYIMAMHLTGNFRSFFDGKPVPPAREADENDPMSQIKLLSDDGNRPVTPSNTGGHLVVIGDANWISAGAMWPMPPPQNVTFMVNLVDWLTLDNNLIAVRSRTLRDKTINTNFLESGSSKPMIIRWINLLLMPVIVAAVGIIISLRRRERIAPAASSPESGNAGEGGDKTPPAHANLNDDNKSKDGNNE